VQAQGAGAPRPQCRVEAPPEARVPTVDDASALDGPHRPGRLGEAFVTELSCKMAITLLKRGRRSRVDDNAVILLK
jgi:hypothetical protein